MSTQVWLHSEATYLKIGVYALLLHDDTLLSTRTDSMQDILDWIE